MPQHARGGDATKVHPCLNHRLDARRPWSYRVLSVVPVSPIYASFLVTFGTAGRHIFFALLARSSAASCEPVPGYATPAGARKRATETPGTAVLISAELQAVPF